MDFSFLHGRPEDSATMVRNGIVIFFFLFLQGCTIKYICLFLPLLL